MAWLYVISNQRLTRYPLEVLASQLEGIDFFQLREKELPANELYRLACKLKKVLPATTKFLINDRVDIALAVQADGVHLGQTSFPVDVARRLLGPGKIIGVSVHDLTEAQRAALAGADYLLFGHVFPTESKKGLPPRGLTNLEEVARKVGIPVIALGGITPDRVRPCLEAGASGVAVMSAIMAAEYPREAVLKFRQALNQGEFPSS
ncbi:thiamine-phosphate pyrophosphorylase [Thermanaeromonas toyohensis ToBE]|uniref:Thiamine-phosphate synthase n=1 Tax=Thermanaeromonas toyohensis ToBE TaxID=698762 RepID=A0A1W1VHB9_9FIRM|nr:thiamine phosphate synthase [Thermanaeromonas toyohensis]SMB92775.1 thiamine-phosphate pyrophosphorylase [Thermanaeromonas toyohensis ToBE]